MNRPGWLWSERKINGRCCVDNGGEHGEFFFPPFCLAAAILLELLKLFQEERLEIGQMCIYPNVQNSETEL